MKWFEFSIHTTNEAIEPISNILHEAGASGVVIEDPSELTKTHEDQFGEIYQLDPQDYPDEGVIIKAYLLENSTLEQTIINIKEAINQLVLYQIDIGKNKVIIREVDEEDWSTAWKKYYHPVKISEKITIVPTWEDYTPTHKDELIIELDPGMAFGTGTHPTTVMCIQALEQFVNEGDHVIDVGTGSGVLSIAAAKLGARSVSAYDLDEVAVTSARQNITLNNVQQTVSITKNNLLDGVHEQADVIVANILAEVVIRLVDQAMQNVKQNGYFITSGIIHQKKQQVIDALEATHFQVIDEIVMGDWIALIAQKGK